MEIPEFFKTLLTKKQIPNLSEEDILVLFPIVKNSDYYIRLDKYLCICVGYIKGVKNATPIRILRCGQTPLLRNHEIETPKGILRVDSLNPFRHKELKYEDYVNFDRSTFLILPEKKKCIRLTLLRERLQLPLFEGGLSQHKLPEEIPVPEPVLTFNIKKKEDIIQHFRNDLLSVHDQLFTSEEFATTEESENYFRDIVLSIYDTCSKVMYGGDVDQTYEAYLRAVNLQAQAIQEQQEIEEWLRIIGTNTS